VVSTGIGVRHLHLIAGHRSGIAARSHGSDGIVRRDLLVPKCPASLADEVIVLVSAVAAVGTSGSKTLCAHRLNRHIVSQSADVKMLQNALKC
jgi:hypothetical protein